MRAEWQLSTFLLEDWEPSEMRSFKGRGPQYTSPRVKLKSFQLHIVRLNIYILSRFNLDGIFKEPVKGYNLLCYVPTTFNNG